MDSLIAETKMIGIYPDMREIEILASIGSPFRDLNGRWGCPAEISGIYGKLGPVYGEDSMQALCLALKLVYTLLKDFIEKGGKLVHPYDKSDFPLRAILGRFDNE